MGTEYVPCRAESKISIASPFALRSPPMSALSLGTSLPIPPTNDEAREVLLRFKVLIVGP